MNMKEIKVEQCKILTLRQTLQSCQSLPSIPLLDTDMDVIGLRSYVLGTSKRIAFICKGIYTHIHVVNA